MERQRPKKKVAERLLKITMIQLRKNGFLKPGEHTGGVAWSDGTVLVKLATTIAGPDGDYLNLRYTARSGIHYDAWIPISTTRCVADLRCWFMCPGCTPTRKVTVLYFDGERFQCRLCSNVIYTSQRKPFADVSRLDSFKPRYLVYRGKPTPRGKRLARLWRKEKALRDCLGRFNERQDKQFEKLKDVFERKFARTTKNQTPQPPIQ